MENSLICFSRPNFLMYATILLCIFIYFFYYHHKTLHEKFSETYLYSQLSNSDLQNKITQLQTDLYTTSLREQQCESSLNSLKQNSDNTGVQDKFLNKIYNPLSPPEYVYPGGTLYTRGYDAYREFQMVGYLSSPTDQYPLFGRYHDPGRSDKWEYYTINESRNRIKIPIKTKNYTELYDGDTVDVPPIGTGLTFNKYNNEELRYSPDV